MWYRVCVGTSPPSTDKPTNGSLPLRARLWRYRLTWWECWIVGLIAFVVSTATLNGEDGGVASVPLPTTPQRNASVSYDVFHVGVTHTWLANISCLYDIPADLAPPGSKAEGQARSRLHWAVRRDVGIVIPIPAMEWVYRYDRRAPMNGALTPSQWYWQWHDNFRRALPITGQSTFAGICPLGILGEIGFWASLILLPLGLCRLGAAAINFNREPPHIHALRKGQCPACGYSIDRTRQRVCPECGDDLTKYPEIERDDAEPRTRV